MIFAKIALAVLLVAMVFLTGVKIWRGQVVSIWSYVSIFFLALTLLRTFKINFRK